MKYLIYLTLFLLSTQVSIAQKKGPYEKYYDNGQLKISGQYKSKKRVGEWEEYYESGELYKIYSYTKGKRNFEKKSYFKNGNLKSKSNKIGNDKFYTEFFENGSLFIEQVIKNGYYKEYYESGELKNLGNYIDWQLSGVWKRFFKSGKTEWEVDYIDGYKQGKYKQFYENGKLKLEGSHHKGKKEGLEKHYSDNGQIIREQIFSKGIHDNKNNKVNLEDIIVPDGNYQRVPVFPGCENKLDNLAVRKCMNKKISQFVMYHFNRKIASNLGLEGKQKIKVFFKIDKTGYVKDVKAKASRSKLEEEAIRIINLLPKMKPGKQLGKETVVPYSLPIVFEVGSKKKSETSKSFVRDN